MASSVFNISKGKVNEYIARIDGNDPTNSVIVVMLLKVNEGHSTLIDYDTFSALLAGSNTECDFTNYARKTITDTGVTAPTPDDSGNAQSSDITTDPVWTSAGGATNNTITMMVTGYDSDSTGGTDANIVPMTCHDVSGSTNGGDVTIALAAAGFFTAS